MTEAEQRTCTMGRAMPKPCPFPATVSLGDRIPEDEPQLCVFHAAVLPLTEELDELGISLELVRTYLKAVRRQPAARHLLAVLEHAEADFSERRGVLDKAIKDLKAAEHELIR